MRSTALSPTRVVFVGWGAIGRTAAGLLDDPSVEIVGIATRGVSELDEVPADVRIFSDPNELASLEPDVVAEAAGRAAVEPWGRTALDVGADFVVSSVSAFADSALLASMQEAAERSAGQIHVQPGAVAGIEALAAAKPMGLSAVEHRIVKPPVAWKGTAADELCNLDALSQPTEFYRASAAETAAAFPKNANVAMTTALAGVGPDDTRVLLVADPTATTNRHEVTAHGAFGSIDVWVSNNPLPANPKTSALAALSLVRTIRNRATAFVV